ncbi:MAG: formiminoglutamase [Caulobacteraceae bacterium]|jgi:N-formylglutamate amidohydrolase|nr:formiminoglutamase [Caulobacteraceae bacterium]
MNAWEPITAARVDESEVFHIARPPPDKPATALVFASPHSGRIYPPGLMAASCLDAESIRQSEDAHVDDLISEAPAHGATVIVARLARAWIDVNREPWELDPAMFEDELPSYAKGRTARVAAGLGSIARIVSDGQEIYHRKLTFAEALARVEAVHRPYHTALAELVAAARQARGAAVLIDWHSMPSAAARHGADARGASARGDGAGCDVVLGDRFGGACAPAVARLAEQCFRDLGYSVARNAPYAGGYTTEHYGRPLRRVHALQVEINRALYMDERTLTPTAGYRSLKADLESVFATLAAVDWAAI